MDSELDRVFIQVANALSSFSGFNELLSFYYWIIQFKCKLYTYNLTLYTYNSYYVDFVVVPSTIWETYSQFLIFYNIFHETLKKLNSSKCEKRAKYLPILHEATCDSYFIFKCLLKANVARVILLTC